MTEIENEKAKLELNIATNPQVIRQYEEREREVRAIIAVSPSCKLNIHRLADQGAARACRRKGCQAQEAREVGAEDQGAQFAYRHTCIAHRVWADAMASRVATAHCEHQRQVLCSLRTYVKRWRC